MKLQSIKIQKNTANNQPVQNIKRTVTLKTVGFLLITGRNKVATTVKKGIATVRIFKTKTARKLANLHIVATFKKVATRMNTMFKQAFVQAGIFESRIKMAKQSLQDAKKKLLSTQEYFALHVELAKACLHMRTFKFSLLPSVKSLLF